MYDINHTVPQVSVGIIGKNPSSHQDQINDNNHQVPPHQPELLAMAQHSYGMGHTAMGQNTTLPSSRFPSNTALKK